MSKNSELACTYACLMLHDEGVEITEARITAICQAAGVTIESYYPMLFAKFLAGKDVGSMLSVSSGGGGGGGGGAAPAAAAAGGAAAPAAAAKVEEVEEEDDDMGFGLFD